MVRSFVEKNLMAYGVEILASDEFGEACLQTHHKRTSVADHTLNVAGASLRICYVLNKLHISTSTEDIVVGSLCHDLGILGRDEKYDTKRMCYTQHPSDSVDVARRLVPDLNEKSARIISTHMWPVTITKLPKSREEVIVSIADKYAAIKDLVVS